MSQWIIIIYRFNSPLKDDFTFQTTIGKIVNSNIGVVKIKSSGSEDLLSAVEEPSLRIYYS